MLRDRQSETSPAPAQGRWHGVDFVAAILLLIFMPLDLPAVQPARAPVAVLLLGYTAFFWRDALSAQQRAWVLWVIPAMCALSALWADVPFLALRYGGLFAFSFLVIGTVAGRLGIRGLILALMVSQGILAVASLLTMATVWVGGRDGGMVVVGIFPHKNVAGAHMMFLSIASVLVLGMARMPLLARVAAGAFLPMALFLVLKSGSATALLLVFGGVPLALFLLVGWRLAAAVRGGRAVLVLGIVALSSAAGLVMANSLAHDPMGTVFSSVGRDKTLTGRTEIWQIGETVVSDHPVLGVGAGNFWRADNGEAQQMANRFYANHVESFSFHNVIMEIRVHLGFVGLLTIGPVYLWIGMQMMRRWWAEQKTGNAAFVVILSLVSLQFFVESELFRPMTFTSIVFFLIGYAAMHGRAPMVAAETIRSADKRLVPA